MSTDIPVVLDHAIYFEAFRNVNADTYPANVTLPSHWLASPSGSWSTANAYVLRAVDVGELIYNGTELSDLQIRNSADDANYNIGFVTIGRANAVFEIRARRQDEDNYVSFKIDFPNQTVSLSKVVDGLETVLSISSKSLVYDIATVYTFEIRTFNDHAYGYVNGARTLSANVSNFRDKHGFSLYTPSVDSADPVAFSHLKIQEIIEQPDPVPATTLIIQARRDAKQQIENPNARTWETYKNAQLLYEQFRNYVYSENTWLNMGYPIAEPSSEEWFG